MGYVRDGGGVTCERREIEWDCALVMICGAYFYERSTGGSFWWEDKKKESEGKWIVGTLFMVISKCNGNGGMWFSENKECEKC